MSNKKATVIAQQAAFAESLGARKYIGYTGNRNNVYVINGGDTCRAEAQFELGMNSQQTLSRLLFAVHSRGVELGEAAGREALQKEMRNLLGIRERDTDGHPRTCVVADYDG